MKIRYNIPQKLREKLCKAGEVMEGENKEYLKSALEQWCSVI